MLLNINILEAYLEPKQTSKMKTLSKHPPQPWVVVNCFRKKLHLRYLSGS